jgi:large-conductance mechanosensitive channel
LSSYALIIGLAFVMIVAAFAAWAVVSVRIRHSDFESKLEAIRSRKCPNIHVSSKVIWGSSVYSVMDLIVGAISGFIVSARTLAVLFHLIEIAENTKTVSFSNA